MAMVREASVEFIGTSFGSQLLFSCHQISQDLDPMAYGCFGSGLQMLDTADIPRHDRIRREQSKLLELAVSKPIGQFGLED